MGKKGAAYPGPKLLAVRENHRHRTPHRWEAMPGRGRPPSTNEWSRERDQRRREAEFTKVAPDGVLRGPELPEGVWHPRTVEWWDTWRRSPMAATFIEGDWSFLLDTAMLHNEMWNGETKHAAEIRLRVGKLAGTPEDRLRLRVQIDTEVAQVTKPARMTDDRRERLLSIVEG